MLAFSNSRLRVLTSGLMVICYLVLAGCTGIPEGLKPVSEFEPNRYLGKWYEIARLDHSFERGLSHVSAEYSLRKDGGLRVINRGYDVNSSEWSTAEGKAYFVRDKNQGYLKVSFFGPFYGSYVVFELDKDNYQYAFVTSNTKNLLWLLARTPEVSPELKTRFISHVNNLGFDTDAIIFVDQNHNRNSR